MSGFSEGRYELLMSYCEHNDCSIEQAFDDAILLLLGKRGANSNPRQTEHSGAIRIEHQGSVLFNVFFKN